MEKIIKDLLSKEILENAILNWNGNFDNLKLIGEVENFVYEYKDEYKNFILRITHSSHRKKEDILAELEWINYLHKNNINVCKPIFSKNNNLLEIINIKNSYFIVCVFEKAKGKFASKESLLNEEFLLNLGSLVGKIHKVSQNYKPINKRMDWFEDDLILNYMQYLPNDKTYIKEEIDELIIFFKGLDNTYDYGLNHADIHSGNFFVDNNEINLFDFDDSCYHFLAYDISIIIFSILFDIEKSEERNYLMPIILDKFMRGYNKEYYLSQKSLDLIPKIMRFRKLLLYVFIYKKWDFSNLNQIQINFLEKLDSI